MQIETIEFLRKGIAQVPNIDRFQKWFVKLGFSSPSDLVLFTKYSWMTLEDLFGIHWAELSPLINEFMKYDISLAFPYGKSPKLELLEECQDLFMSNQIDILMNDSKITELLIPSHIVTVDDYYGFVKTNPAEYMRMKQFHIREITQLNSWLHEFGFDVDGDGWRER